MGISENKSVDVSEEAGQYDDILQANFNEHFFNLTLKDHLYLDYLKGTNDYDFSIFMASNRFHLPS